MCVFDIKVRLVNFGLLSHFDFLVNDFVEIQFHRREESILGQRWAKRRRHRGVHRRRPKTATCSLESGSSELVRFDCGDCPIGGPTGRFASSPEAKRSLAE